MPSITLTLDAANASRVASAVGRVQGLFDGNGTPRDATLAEVKAYITDQLRRIVRDQERAAAVAQAESGIADLAVT